MDIATPSSISSTGLGKFLGGPVGTAEEFLATLAGRSMEPGALSLVHSCLHPEVSKDLRVLRALLTNEGANLVTCIGILSSSLQRMYLDDERDEVVNLTPETRRAAELLAACPGIASAQRAAFAWQAIGMDDAQLEVYSQLVTDRAWEISVSMYDGPDVLQQCSRVAKSLDA